MQNIYDSTEEEVLRFLRSCRGNELDHVEASQCAAIADRSWRPDERPFWIDLFHLARWSYVSVDLIDAATIRADLNVWQVQPDHVGAFDIVANVGTTEHVFNQLPIFTAMHYATRVGGCMLHFVPVQGFRNHCFYRYDPKFFVLLAEANGYEVVHAGLFGESFQPSVDESHRTWAEYQTLEGQNHRNVIGEFILRKLKETDFRHPADIEADSSKAQVEFAGRCKSIRRD